MMKFLQIFSLIVIFFIHTNQVNAMTPEKKQFSKEKIQKFYTDILEKKNIKMFDYYFTPDCVIKIGEHVFSADSFKQRMAWLKKNTKKVSVEVTNFFTNAEADQMTDYHISTAIDNKSIKHVVHNIVHMRLKNGKISEFILMNYFETPHKTDVAHAK